MPVGEKEGRLAPHASSSKKPLFVGPAMQSPVEIRAKGLSPWQCSFCMKWYSSNCAPPEAPQSDRCTGRQSQSSSIPPQLLRLRRATPSCIRQIRRKSPQRSSSELALKHRSGPLLPTSFAVYVYVRPLLTSACSSIRSWSVSSSYPGR
jgi:hypothetical protein